MKGVPGTSMEIEWPLKHPKNNFFFHFHAPKAYRLAALELKIKNKKNENGDVYLGLR
jgi:hypothetical protein